MDAPETFRFREDVLRAAAARTRRRLLLSALATAGLLAALWALAFRPRGAGWGALAIALALLAALAVRSLRRRLDRLHARWGSFVVTVDGEAVARTVEGFPPVRIARGEVASVGEHGGGVVVRDRGGRALLLPRELDGYDRLRARLAAWGAPQPAPEERR